MKNASRFKNVELIVKTFNKECKTMSVRKIRKQIHFHSGQRWAVTIIILLIIAVIVHGKLITSNYVKSPYNNEEHIAILDQIKSKSDHKKTIHKKNPVRQKLTPIPFNPNKVTTEELVAMGINEKSAKSWVKYTSKGGKFRKAKDLKKLYFMNDKIYSQLEPFVNIPEPKKGRKQQGKYGSTAISQAQKKQIYSNYERTNIEKNKSKEDSLQTDHRPDEIAYKNEFRSRKNAKRSGIKENYIISINETDSIELQMLKGIGPVLSSRIIKYKEQLGGFHNKNQLLEVYGVKPSLLSDILDQLSFEGALQKIKINHIELEELVKHPYFNYQTAQIFINYRKQHGDYKSLNDVKKIKIIKDYWLEETAPYFDYEPS